MRRIVIIAAVVCECAYAQSNYCAVLTNMVTALRQPRGTLDASFTNQLALCAGSITNASHLANVNIVQAISLTDVAEDDLTGDALLPLAASICSNILASLELPSNAWQRGAAGITLSGINSFDGKRLLACYAVTNGVVATAHNISSADDIYLWNAIAKHLDVEGLTVQEALRCYAAVAIIGNDSTCDITSYTNGLPESVLVKIRELSGR